MAYEADVTILQEIIERMGQVANDFGKIDILVNNAGWDKIQPFMETTEKTWDRIIGINYRGTINCTRAVLDHMIPQGEAKLLTYLLWQGK